MIFAENRDPLFGIMLSALSTELLSCPAAATGPAPLHVVCASHSAAIPKIVEMNFDSTTDLWK
ncbi:hypothetical protein HNR60_002340 [Rhodopseudomonas rhenobacensis]|uniref:Uncharacterized protein n=1 Tax=Rhodopseudomonas rhenobacensis TaxID=87461 RepID=A0A7W8DZ31_9BRAD|nr:hypothetical protein [Rhodopseudomonas rhenobacensis]MBB5047583.1 hypothetical protein [Rhodopseudomonas rhenobacensis]